MTQNSYLSKKLAEELHFVHGKMKATDNPAEKLFYLTAVYGAIHRIMNIEYDDDLVFAHQVVQLAYNQVNSRLQAARQGDSTVSLSPSLFEAIESAVEELRLCLGQGKSPSEPLKKLAVLGYSTTGNGYYLQVKGDLRIRAQ